MAKLSAHGRKEYARFVKVHEPEPEGTESDHIIGARTEYRLMTDGTILRCTFWTRINPFSETPESTSTGWKSKGRIKPGLTLEQAAINMDTCWLGKHGFVRS